MLSALALTAFLFTAKSGHAFSGTGQHYNTAWEAVYDHNQSAIAHPNPTEGPSTTTTGRPLRYLPTRLIARRSVAVRAA